MASIDIITATGLAYKRMWDERRYLLPMALIPILVKYICLTMADMFVDQNNILRLTFFMIPAYFVEGWLLSHWVRTILVGHRWPFRPSGDMQSDLQKLKVRGRGVLSGSIAFTLINFLIGGYVSFFMTIIPFDLDPQDASPMVAMIGAVMMVSGFLLFRFIWFYIPLAVNVPPSLFIKNTQRLGLTLNMLGLWLVCFVPTVLLLQVSSGLVLSIGGVEAHNPLADSIVNLLRVVMDTLKNLICTAGMAYAFGVWFKGQAK